MKNAILSIIWGAILSVSQDRTPKVFSANKEARIVFDGGKMEVSCNVQSLSRVGAVLQLNSTFRIPSAFRLHLENKTQHPCWVIKKSTKTITVVFTDV